MMDARGVVMLVLLVVVAMAVLSQPTAPKVEPFLDKLSEDAIAPKYLKALDAELMRLVTGSFIQALDMNLKATTTKGLKPACKGFINDARKNIVEKVAQAKLSTASRQKELTAAVNRFADVVQAFVLYKHCGERSKEGYIRDVDDLRDDLANLHESLAEQV